MSIKMKSLISLSVSCIMLLAMHIISLTYPYIAFVIFILFYTLLFYSVCVADSQPDPKTMEEAEDNLVAQLNNAEDVKRLITKLYTKLFIIRNKEELENDN